MQQRGPAGPEDRAPSFGAALRRWRELRGLSLRQLGGLVAYSPGWLSKIENGVAAPTAQLARVCDRELRSGGELIGLANAATVDRKGFLRPAQLPAGAAGSFVGREGQLGELDEFLAGAERPDTVMTVVIDGPPGVGKTSLAVCWAHHIADYFPDGVLFADLRGYSPEADPVDPSQVLEGFLRAFGVPANSLPSEVDQRAAMFRSVLDGRRVLVVLDNAADSRQVQPLLAGAAGCGVVVTSRRRLSGLATRTGLRRVTLGPLLAGESVALLSAVIGDRRADAEPEAIRDLARSCAHLPLALRIAAERVATHPHHTVGELVTELADERHRLDVLAAADDDSLAVRTVFSWSYRDLSATAARMFRLLGLHRGPHISASAAGAMAGLPTTQARLLLERLTAVHLLEEVVHDRYRLHDLLKAYAAECAEAEDSAADRRAAVRRLTDWYLHTAAKANRVLAPFRMSPLELDPPAEGVEPLDFADDVAGLRWCDAELANLVPVTQLAVNNEQYEMAWRFAVALFDYLMVRQPGRVWVATHELALTGARAAGNRYAEGWVENNLAEAHRWLRHFDRSHELFHHALTVREEAGDRHGQAWTLAGLAFVAVERGEIGPARAYAERALALFREFGDPEGQVWTLASIGDMERRSDRIDQALALLEAALQKAEQIDDPYGQAWTLPKLAEVQLAMGNQELALDYLDRAITASRRARDRLGEAEMLARRGRLHNDLGRIREARESWAAALTRFEEMGDPRAVEIRDSLSSTV